MKQDKLSELRHLLRDLPNTARIVEAVVEIWPGHASYIYKSMSVRDDSVLNATEIAAASALKLIDGRMSMFAADYVWTCDNFREEEFFFFREGRYRLSTFSEAMEKVYSDGEYMKRYMNGLLVCSITFYNHAHIFEMYLNRVIAKLTDPVDYLEVGPGNGLKMSFAAKSPKVRSLEAWDVSEISLQDTRNALNKLNVQAPIKLDLVDLLSAKLPDRKFGLIVISEVLEHLEDPAAALSALRSMITDDGRLFITVPLNSPAPDHIYLLSEPRQLFDLIETQNFRVEDLEFYATQGEPLQRALEDKISISAGVVARPV